MVFSQPLEELEDVGITRMEGAVVVVVPAEIEKSLCHLSAVASIVILITAIRGKTANEEFSLAQLKVVWRVHHNPIVPPVMVADRLALDNLWVLLQFLGKASYLGIYILITEAYVAQSLEVPVAQTKAEVVHRARIRLTHKEAVATLTLGRYTAQEVVITLLRNLFEGLAESLVVAFKQQGYAVRRYGDKEWIVIPITQLLQSLTAIVAMHIITHRGDDDAIKVARVDNEQHSLQCYVEHSAGSNHSVLRELSLPRLIAR